MLKAKWYGLLALMGFCVCGLFPAMGHTAEFKVLVVMSYEEISPFEVEMKEGIESVMASTCDIRYFYMDTKIHPEGGKQKAAEAYALYQEFQPDGVIAADDNAQSMFVVPYLKDKVKTPVMFCGVNDTPEKYGYPASNVSGILERHHIRESIAFLQLMAPSVKTIGYLTKKNASGQALMAQIQGEADTYTASFAAFELMETLEETVNIIEKLKEKCDALYVPSMQKITDENGRPLTDKEVIPIIVRNFSKPVISGNAHNMKYGVLCSVVKTGQEHGETASRMLLDAMKGTPVSQIPITRNHKGKPMINVETMRALGIKIQPKILHGAELIKTEK